ncbi:MAG: terpene cyclase/mutase family protein, partial [Lentisphaerae bacterium]|nr:terpene cyclase/mutase family protein [Lentisphaerota bacterium]
MPDSTSDDAADPVRSKEEQALAAIDERFREDGYYTRIKKMIRGFGRPRDTREFKEARLEAQRLAAPLCAVLIPLIAVILIVLLAADVIAPEPTGPTVTFKPEPPEPPELVPVPPTPQPPQPPDDTSEKINRMGDVPTIPTPTPTPEWRPQPQPEWQPQPPQPPSTNPPVVVIPTNGPWWPDPPPPTNGPPDVTASEQAVMRALRWLKKNQQADGSWPQNRVAMTGLAVLTFLSHSETPATSPEFGETVQRGIQFLMGAQETDGRFKYSDSHEYALPIAAYALSEASGMIPHPDIKEAADRAVHVLVTGQNASGGWDYNMKGSERNDTSVMSWCAQALKAAQLANAYRDKPALTAAMKKAVRGFRQNYQSGGGFGYDKPGANGLSAAGALCLQLLGAGGAAETRATLDLMDAWTPAFLAGDAKGLGGSIQYYYYYATQAKFHAGINAKRWTSWWDKLWRLYVRAQRIELGAYTDPQGRPQEIGWWENTDAHTDRPVMDTCLAAIQ